MTLSSENPTLTSQNRARRRVRIWVLAALAPFALAGILLSAKILSMYAFAHQSISSYLEGDHAASITAAHNQEVLNWFEPWKAPYNVGVGLAGAGDLGGAQEKFEEALPLTSGVDECPVRINLALVIEWQGDAARADGNAEGAAQRYGEAMLVLADAPEECDTDEADKNSPDPERDMSESKQESEERLREKQQQQQEKPQEPEDPQDPQDEEKNEPDDSSMDELRERLQEGAQERDQYRQDDEGDGSSGSGTDKPW